MPQKTDPRDPDETIPTGTYYPVDGDPDRAVGNLTEAQLGVVCALRRCGWSATEGRLLEELGVANWTEYSDDEDPIPWSIVDRDADGVLHLTESPSGPCCSYCDEAEDRDHDQGVPATADDLAAAAVDDYLEADDE